MKQSTAVSTKKFFFAVAFILVVAVGSVSAANEPDINDAVRESFKKEFAGANLLEWNETGGFLKATFILGNHRTEAYFREDGQLEGSIRSLFYNELPLLVMTSIDKRFANAVIWDVNEINNSLGTVYRITLEVKQKKYSVKVDATGNIQATERLKK
jgi:hypothetical protein